MSKVEGESDNKKKITVKYYNDEGIIDEKTFDPDDRFKNVIDYFNKESPGNVSLKTKDKYILNNRLIGLNEPVKNLIHVNKENTLEEGELWLEVEEQGNAIVEEEPFMTKILKPKMNPFGLAIYRPENGVVGIEEYPESVIKKYGLEHFNYTSAYCDSPEYLFISGGENNGEVTDDFWIINHTNYRIKYKKMLHPKKNHSMIFIPEGFVFIVGGNDEKTFYYDLKYDEFINCGNLNAVHLEPALFRYNDWLYCFNSLINNIEFFEKTSVTRFSGRWEKVFLSYSSEEAAKFDNKFYGVCKTTKDKILFVGGRDTDANSFVFDPKNNRISVAEGTDTDVDLADKKFYPIDKKFSVAIPKYFEEDQDLAVVNKITRSMKTTHLDEGKSLRYVKQNLLDQPSVGELYIKAKVNWEDEIKKTTFKSLGPRSLKIKDDATVVKNVYKPNKVFRSRLIPSRFMTRDIDAPKLSHPTANKVTLQIQTVEESKNPEPQEENKIESQTLFIPEVKKKEETGEFALKEPEVMPIISEDGQLKQKRPYTFQKQKDIFNPYDLKTLSEDFKGNDNFEIERTKPKIAVFPNIGEIDVTKYPNSKYNRNKEKNELELKINEESNEKQSDNNNANVQEEPIILRAPQGKNSNRKLILPPKQDLAQPNTEEQLIANTNVIEEEKSSSSEEIIQKQNIEEPANLIMVEKKLKSANTNYNLRSQNQTSLISPEPKNQTSLIAPEPKVKTANTYIAPSYKKVEPVTLIEPKLKTVKQNTTYLKSQANVNQNKNMILFRDTISSRVGSILPTNYPQKKCRVSQTAFCDYKL